MQKKKNYPGCYIEKKERKKKSPLLGLYRNLGERLCLHGPQKER